MAWTAAAEAACGERRKRVEDLHTVVWQVFTLIPTVTATSGRPAIGEALDGGTVTDITVPKCIEVVLDTEYKGGGAGVRVVSTYVARKAAPSTEI